MNLYQGKRFLKTAGVILAIISGFAALVVGLSCLIDSDHYADQQAMCAPDGMVQTFYYDHHYHAICIRKDGSMFVSEKLRK